MTKWTKADIDGLVDALPTSNMWTENPGDTLRFDSCTDKVQRSVLRTALYFAAGLTAEGEAKPETRIVWIATSKYAHSIQRPVVWDREPTIAERLNMPTTTFTRYTVIPGGAA